MTRNEDWLEAYSRSLERQIETKEDFLRQATDTIKLLKDQKVKDPRFKDIKPVNEKVWKSLLKRALIFPERSDPIGLSLANTSLHSRKVTSESYLNYLKLKYELLEEANTNQKAINYNLTKLINAFNKTPSDNPEGNSGNEVIQDMNKKYWSDLKECVQRNLFSAELSEEDTEIVMQLLHRLATIAETSPEVEPVTVSSFQQSETTKQLYRVLLRGDLIQVGPIQDGGSNDDRTVQLEDFLAEI